MYRNDKEIMYLWCTIRGSTILLSPEAGKKMKIKTDVSFFPLIVGRIKNVKKAKKFFFPRRI